MKRHQDLIAILRAKKIRITPLRRLLVQFVIDHRKEQPTLKDIQDYLEKHTSDANRSSVYRNLELLKKLEFIQELDFPDGKRFQYIFDRQVHHYYICKSCGKLNRGNKDLFDRIERVLKDFDGFEKANLSLVFYGYCTSCAKDSSP